MMKRTLLLLAALLVVPSFTPRKAVAQDAVPAAATAIGDLPRSSVSVAFPSLATVVAVWSQSPSAQHPFDVLAELGLTVAPNEALLDDLRIPTTPRGVIAWASDRGFSLTEPAGASIGRLPGDGERVGLMVSIGAMGGDDCPARVQAALGELGQDCRATASGGAYVCGELAFAARGERLLLMTIINGDSNDLANAMDRWVSLPVDALWRGNESLNQELDFGQPTAISLVYEPGQGSRHSDVERWVVGLNLLPDNTLRGAAKIVLPPNSNLPRWGLADGPATRLVGGPATSFGAVRFSPTGVLELARERAASGDAGAAWWTQVQQNFQVLLGMSPEQFAANLDGTLYISSDVSDPQVPDESAHTIAVGLSDPNAGPAMLAGFANAFAQMGEIEARSANGRTYYVMQSATTAFAFTYRDGAILFREGPGSEAIVGDYGAGRPATEQVASVLFARGQPMVWWLDFGTLFPAFGDTLAATLGLAPEPIRALRGAVALSAGFEDQTLHVQFDVAIDLAAFHGAIVGPLAARQRQAAR